MMYQQITLVGFLGDDPTMRFTPSGVPVTAMSVAVNKSWTTPDGQRQDKTTWFRVTAWRGLAEVANQYLKKGRQVLVIGEVEDARAYTDRDGNLRASLEVTAREIKFLGQAGCEGGQKTVTLRVDIETGEAHDDGGFPAEDIPF